MKTQEILTIIGLSCLGLCLLLCLLKMSMKDKKGQANCDKVCGMLFFAAAVLIGVSQLLKETSESYGSTLNCKNSSGGPGAVCPGDSSKCQNMGKPTGCPFPSGSETNNPYRGSNRCYTPDSSGCAKSGASASPGGGSCSPPPGKIAGAYDTNGPLIAAAGPYALANSCQTAAAAAGEYKVMTVPPSANNCSDSKCVKRYGGKEGCSVKQPSSQTFVKGTGCHDLGGMNVSTRISGVGKCVAPDGSSSCRVYKQ